MSELDIIFNECYLSTLETLTLVVDEPHERHLLADRTAEDLKKKLKELVPKPCVVMSNKHPAQPIKTDTHGVRRFKENKIVRYLLDAGPFDMNHLAILPFSKDDHAQFAQLIGYSVCGFGDLSYVDDETFERATKDEPEPPKGE